ncbi:hypothetical protein [Glutamicibacter nicotianae]|uniref:hypothetical protein n=1 Tax=Glutamicibacter nicotianae TaxID=37929 RepID=UPI002553664E|nr:hypothetical protein [Glutamicibacter nicotianae]WIV43056.1 hypothetical protein QQS42_12130 [Glutamicibacter nicotianae]
MTAPGEPFVHLDDNGELLGVLDLEKSQWDARNLAAQLVASAGRDPESITTIILNSIKDDSAMNGLINLTLATQRLTDVIGTLLGGEYNQDTADIRRQHVTWLLGAGTDGQPPTMPASDQ